MIAINEQYALLQVQEFVDEYETINMSIEYPWYVTSQISIIQGSFFR